MSSKQDAVVSMDSVEPDLKLGVAQGHRGDNSAQNAQPCAANLLVFQTPTPFSRYRDIVRKPAGT